MELYGLPWLYVVGEEVNVQISQTSYVVQRFYLIVFSVSVCSFRCCLRSVQKNNEERR
jgi:hypothetical protein